MSGCSSRVRQGQTAWLSYDEVTSLDKPVRDRAYSADELHSHPCLSLLPIGNRSRSETDECSPSMNDIGSSRLGGTVSPAHTVEPCLCAVWDELWLVGNSLMLDHIQGIPPTAKHAQARSRRRTVSAKASAEVGQCSVHHRPVVLEIPSNSKRTKCTHLNRPIGARDTSDSLDGRAARGIWVGVR